MRQGFVGNGGSIVIVSKPVVGTVQNERGSGSSRRFVTARYPVQSHGCPCGDLWHWERLFRRVREIANTGHVRRVSQSVRMEQIGSHLTDFHEIWYLVIFRNTFEKIPSVIKL
jgi:hypothetical protein